MMESSQLSQQQQEMTQQLLPFAYVQGEAVIEQPADLFIPPESLTVLLENFEGPLDLLLYLIRKQKLDILDLPIATISQQYNQYVNMMEVIDLELASDYMVMAAVLAEIKSKILLPKPAIVEEEVDPRQELVRRLQAYEKVKLSAQYLDELPRVERDFLVAGTIQQDTIDEMQNNAINDSNSVYLADLVKAMERVLRQNQVQQHHHIQKDSISIEDKMAHVLARLQQITPLLFSQLLHKQEGKMGCVASFIALLTLIKQGQITCDSTCYANDIQVSLIK